MTDDIRNQSLDQVAEMMAGCQPNSMNDQTAKAEFYRRQTLAIQETTVATRRYTLYMLISVLLLLVSVLGSLAFDYLNYSQHR
jgi:cytochrome c-type biogenesis protein CcmH/NrfG